MTRTLTLTAVLCLVALGSKGTPTATTGPAPQAPRLVADAITIPQMLSYQGRLTDSLGQPVTDTTYSLEFRLYTVPSGGSPLWNETQSVMTRGGLFSVLLGSVTPVGSVPDAGTLYLGMAVDGGSELVPRLRIVSAAYAYKADTANYALSGGTPDNPWVRVGSDSVLYTIHRLGIARGGAGNALYGSQACTHTNLGVACTTGTSGQNNPYATVGGGYANSASGIRATVGGGEANSASGNAATVAGGESNRASGGNASVGGGIYNAASQTWATVAGGFADTASASYATVGGGRGNIARDYAATVGGGYNNTADSNYATVGGGRNNVAGFYAATVGGGYNNTATGNYATVGGGYGNDATGGSATIAGGYNNSADSSYPTVGGGYGNVANGNYATVPGGYMNRASGPMSFAGGCYAKVYGEGSFLWSDSCGPADSISFATDNSFRVRSRGGAVFWTVLDCTRGVMLPTAGTAWLSFGGDKDDVRPVDKRALLEALARLRVREYSLKGQDPSIRHIGPVAQDFHSSFGFGESNAAINMADADGVLLAAVQALYEQNQAQQAEIEALKAEHKRR